jgi:hypothetical protein
MGLLDDAIKEHLELKRRRGADAGEISRLESEALGPVPRSPEGVPELADTFEPPQDELDAAGAEGAAPSQAATSRPSEDEPPAGRGPPPQTRSEPPPSPSAHEPPAVPPPPSAYEPLPATPPPHPDATPALGSASAPPYEPPPVVPPPAREPWMTDDLEPEPEPEPLPEPEPEPEAGSGGLFSRLRGGRRSKHDRELQPPPAAPEPGLDAAPPPHSSQEPAPAAQHEPDIVPADEEPDVEDLLEETPEFLEETPEHDRLWFEQRPPRDFNFDD